MKKRKDSFLGIHFDFHAMPGEVVPTFWQPEVYAEMLDAVKPDYTQCDTKGHAGLSSYPTKAGNQATVITQDILRMMREKTAERGIPLYGHHSGLYDCKAVELHPDWAVIDANGNIDHEHCSVFSPFVDELLLPQLRELAGTYHLNGAWIDGECWGTRLDYSPYAVKKYQNLYHRNPPRPGDDDFEQYREFCRQGFKDYVQHYVSAIKSEYPEFEITSNWIFSQYMPEKADVSVDFLSGDYSSTNSVESARFHGRILEARNMPWDLMAWGHNAIPCSWMTHNRNTKELEQYCQEAAVIIAMGGGFECFNILYGHGGTVQKWAIPIWQGMAQFCRQRELCFKSRIRPELGVIYPNDRNAPQCANLYGGNPGAPALTSWINLLQDCQYSTKVILEHQLWENPLDNYQAIVLPAAGKLAPEAQNALAAYVQKGGRLVVDAQSAHWLPQLTGCQAGTTQNQLLFVEGGEALTAGEIPCVKLAPETAVPSGWAHDDNYFEANRLPVAYINKIGSGSVCTLAFSMQHFYANNRSTAIRDFIKEQLSQLGFQPLVSVSGSVFADVTVTEKDGELLVSLVNFAGAHNVGAVRSYGEVPKIGPLEITIRRPVNSVTLMPGNQTMELACNADGSTTVTLPQLHIHSILVIGQ